ncbi:hypothetical protein FA15DRAFT_582319 [Coprinopsis marcescibilis]|uniref:Helicase ATP-binding domain-containing protein n=1 Tax=Coprinopsis marcescibilis TaxID=230819 RepID=A0A5C3LLI0_COPMA|nr:hypothetical protein FA15DRAFT_582319 [Coprinopsis marcescibilis]
MVSYVSQDLIPSDTRIPRRLEKSTFPRRTAGRDTKQFVESFPYRKSAIIVGLSLSTNSAQEIEAVAFSFGFKSFEITLDRGSSLPCVGDLTLQRLLSGNATFPSKDGDDFFNTFIMVGFDMARMATLIHKYLGFHTHGFDLGSLLAPDSASPWGPARVVANRLHQGELELLEYMVAESHALDQLKPRAMQNEFSSYNVRKDGKVDLQNDRYKTRVRRSNRQAVVITMASGREYTTRAVGMQGKKTTLGAVQLSGGIASIRVVGRQELTSSERALEHLLLTTLQGLKSFQQSPFIRLFWFPTWKRFKPPPESFRLNSSAYNTVMDVANLNVSQKKVIDTLVSSERAVIVHGPPGTGKTTTIATISRIWDLHDCPVWIVAHSNVAVKNIANALGKRNVDFRLIVSKEFHEEWHEHLYASVQEKLIRSDEFPKDPSDMERLIGGACIILSTLSMLSNPALEQNRLFELVPMERLIVDEVSQIRVFEFLVRISQSSKARVDETVM